MVRGISISRAGAVVTVWIAAAALSLAACGSDGSPDTPPASPPPATSQSAYEAPNGPEGTLSETSFGSVEQGMEIREAMNTWGQPDDRRHFPGCELDPSAPYSEVLVWNVPDGDVMLSFNAETERLDSYRTSSRKFPTQTGVRIGDSFAVLKGSEGAALSPLNLGIASTPKDGYWYTGDPTRAEQLFTVAGGKITMISGGFLPVCE